MRGFRVNKNQYILQRSQEAKTILHVGCTGAPSTSGLWREGKLLHKHLCDRLEGWQRLVGVDIDEPSVNWLKERMPEQELFVADAHRLSNHFGTDTRFNLILVPDVIEHLSNPGLFLESARSVLAPGGRILLTTINAFGIVRFAKALLDHEAVNPEHTVYFSHGTLKHLSRKCGLRVVKLGYYRCKPMTHFSLNTLVSNTFEHAAASAWPQLSEGVLAEMVVDGG